MAVVGSRSRRAEMNWATICCSAFSCLQLYWARLVIRKWFNVSSFDSDYSADTDDDRLSLSGSQDFDPRSSGATNDDDCPKLRRRNSETFRVQYIDTQAVRICAGTWNVGGTVPPADLDIDGWLDTLEPADIYVLGLQEIVPLNAGNIFGIEDDQPASEWENIIRDALNRVRPRNPKSLSHSDPPSPSMFKVSHDMFLETRHGACDTFFSCERPILSEDSLTNIEVLDSTNDNASPSMQITSDSQREERFSYNERVGLSWPEPPLKLLNQYVLERRGGAFKSLNLSIMNLRKPAYVRIVSKQMVGVFLTVWVRRSLRKHISNLSVSNVGVGIMGYIGNKGSVSVSMSIYQTPFCFLCSHLSSGEKDTDHQKRNDDVREIHRRTLFHPHSSSASVLPRSIRDHERVIWLGDLNYRINLSYEKTHELIARKEWQRLLENDQLSNEMRKGNVFEGWSEGVLCFPPTYKYEIDSENYIGDDPESGKRRPAWCDRVIWKGKGMKLLSYRRNEIKLSDHRPVTATFLAEVEVLSLWKLQRALAITYAEIQSQ
ncbi:hypothetical protein BRARA_E01933 [Brassica rapa]|uniref:Inositol polyphosphate-related phosphatase domain-containing protein n=2 Tax=Brassica TaxID=3705 RepID=M4F051_BRACM|nr:type I inositol polyphosphate 5-phosphatase 1 isoform X1 [Brassica rapa]RID62892.1 hypothetical protein BRARA_E01933 [Brassica rapa]CAF2098758.1 unnamed protein product [Brassica napus]CDY28392.1 BnaA05g18480D [Brassica napus]